jgi:hypothetical protein
MNACVISTYLSCLPKQGQLFFTIVVIVDSVLTYNPISCSLSKWSMNGRVWINHSTWNFFIFCISILLETLSDLIITYEVLYNHKKISFLLTNVLFVRVTEALISCLILSFIEAIYFNIFIIYVFRLLIEEKI